MSPALVVLLPLYENVLTVVTLPSGERVAGTVTLMRTGGKWVPCSDVAAHWVDAALLTTLSMAAADPATFSRWLDEILECAAARAERQQWVW